MSRKQVGFRSAADADLDEIEAYYLLEAGEALAARFAIAVRTAVRRISEHPGIGSLRYAVELNVPDLRYCPVRRFPYLIFYVESDTEIDVWRIVHTHRDIQQLLGSEESKDAGY